LFIGLFAIPAIIVASAAAAVSCDESLAQRLDTQIRDARSSKSWAAMNDSALRLAGLYDSCAASETGREYFEDSLRLANALLSAGAADLEQHHDTEARRPFSVARSIFSVVSGQPDVPPDIKEDATQRLAFIEKRLPWLVQSTVDPSVMPAARATATPPPLPASPEPVPSSPPPTDYDVLQTWVTPFAGALQTLHVRLNLHPQTTCAVTASDFRLSIPSRENGRESVYGRIGPAPAYRKTDYWSSTSNQFKLVPTVDPAEDLGARGSFTLHGGDAITRVVTFVVRSDADVGPDTIASLSWNHH
jgi:hypothetical protein